MLSEASLNRNSHTERVFPDREPEITEALSLTNHISEMVLLLRNTLGSCRALKIFLTNLRYHYYRHYYVMYKCTRARFTSSFIHAIQNYFR